jgi:DNA-binding MarR family transcriptional regulator
VRKAIIGHAVDILLARGQVTRASDPTDARAKLVSLTPAGQELAKVVDRRFGELAAVVRRRTNRTQRAAMVELLTLMTENLQSFAAADFT